MFVLKIKVRGGPYIYINTNGVHVVDEIEVKNKREVFSTSHLKFERDLVSPPSGSTGAIYFNLECPIDAENRCSESKVRVGDLLNDIYGPKETLQRKETDVKMFRNLMNIKDYNGRGFTDLIGDDDDLVADDDDNEHHAGGSSDSD